MFTGAWHVHVGQSDLLLVDAVSLPKMHPYAKFYDSTSTSTWYMSADADADVDAEGIRIVLPLLRRGELKISSMKYNC